MSINKLNLPTGILYNPTGNNLPNLRVALNKVKNNLANSTILWIGTSTVAGAQSGGNGLWNQAFTLEYLTAQNMTNRYGILSNNDCIFGFPNVIGSDQRNTDTRMTVGSGWGTDSVWSIGGQMFLNNSTTNNLSFTLPTTADTVVIWYPVDNAVPLGSFSYQINSGSTTTINQGGSSPALASTIITVTPGSNTLNIARVSGTVKIIGYQAYLSTASTATIINSGVSGATAGSFNAGGGKPYGLPTVLATFAPDAILVQMVNNDAIAGTNVNTYKSNMNLILQGGAAHTDCVIIAQEPYGSAGGTVSNLPAYTTAQQQLAAADSLPFINQTNRITSYDSVASPLGFTNNDGLHASPAGYIDQADFLTNQLMGILGFEAFNNLDVNSPLADAAAGRTYSGTNTFSGATTLSGGVSGNTVGSGTFSATRLISTISTGTAPLSVTSTTPVTNLSIGGNAGTVTTINGLITQGTNVTITGSGTSGSPYNIASSGGGSAAFNTITSGTNTTAAMVVGSGGTLGTTGTGTITPTTINGLITNGTNVTISGSGTVASPYSIASSGGSSAAFNTITSGTNTTAAMVVGSGGTLTTSGTGSITASALGTNVRYTPRVTSISSSATPTVNTDACDAVSITALATNITSMTSSLTGTPNNFDKLMFRILDNGTARTITWGASFVAKGVALPTTTVLSKLLTVGFVWDSVAAVWECVASAQEV